MVGLLTKDLLVEVTDELLVLVRPQMMMMMVILGYIE